jgi:hypothetical protein
MKSIKFSDHYVKMPDNVKNNSIVRLIEVLNARFEDLHKSFIEYDARTVKDDVYPLPKRGDCLVLLFIGEGLLFDSAELFTTVRRSTPEKEQYYKGLCGQELIVSITESIDTLLERGGA